MTNLPFWPFSTFPTIIKSASSEEANERLANKSNAAVVPIVNVEVAVLFAAGVTQLALNAQLGSSDSETERVRLTALLNLFSEVTEVVELAEYPD